jgi:hypothetical protein
LDVVLGHACSNNPVVLGANNANLPRILTIVVDAFARQAFDVDDATGVRERMMSIVKFLQVG